MDEKCNRLWVIVAQDSKTSMSGTVIPRGTSVKARRRKSVLVYRAESAEDWRPREWS